MGKPLIIRRWAEALRRRLRDWLGVDEWVRPVKDLQDARRAVVALDLAVGRDRGHVVLLVPRPQSLGGDIVRIFEIPSGMTMAEVDRFIRELEHRVRGVSSLMDAPLAMHPLMDQIRSGRIPFPDDRPRAGRPGW